jgi:hypothetical protein
MLLYAIGHLQYFIALFFDLILQVFCGEPETCGERENSTSVPIFGAACGEVHNASYEPKGVISLSWRNKAQNIQFSHREHRLVPGAVHIFRPNLSRPPGFVNANPSGPGPQKNRPWGRSVVCGMQRNRRIPRKTKSGGADSVKKI